MQTDDLIRHVHASGSPRIAVVLPCCNEAQTIGAVVADFRRALPAATIYVVDNASTDATGDIARAAGTKVLFESVPGKGNAVRRAFAAIDADIYVLADGDGTYDAAGVTELIELMARDHLDVVVARRRKVGDKPGRTGHDFGNRMFNRALEVLFDSRYQDVFSGYRVLSRRFVKSFPACSSGFEIETEMAVHAVLLRMPAAELTLDYKDRVEGSESKLRTFRDGARIAWVIGRLIRQYRPLLFFSITAGLLYCAALGLFVPVLLTYLETGLVPRVPTLIVSAALAVAGTALTVCGIILDAIVRSQLEVRRLFYLNSEGAVPGSRLPRGSS